MTRKKTEADPKLPRKKKKLELERGQQQRITTKM